MRVTAKVVTVDTNNKVVAVLPLSMGVSHIPVEPVRIPLSAFYKAPRADSSIVYEVVDGKARVLEVSEQT